MVPVKEQKELRDTNLGGKVRIDPRTDDFFVRMIEERSVLKRSNKSLADFLKVLANAGSYGLFVQVESETRNKPIQIKVFSGENRRTISSEYVEKAGALVFPALGIADHGRRSAVARDVGEVRQECGW